MKSMKCVCMIKHLYTDCTLKFSKQHCIMQGYNNAQARAIAKTSNIQYNSLHVHKSNVKLHELDVYSQHIVVIYLPM